VTLTPVREAVVGRDLQTTSMLFLGVVGFVLLICCANVANLLLARARPRAGDPRCAVTALVVGALFGVAPAWQVGDLTSARFIAADTRTTTGGGGRLRSALAVSEVAVSALLLVGAGLLLRTLLAVQGVDRGNRAGDILTMVVDPLGSRYPTDEALQQFYEEVAAEVGAALAVAGPAWRAVRVDPAATLRGQ
jgi:hypothetical protein